MRGERERGSWEGGEKTRGRLFRACKKKMYCMKKVCQNSSDSGSSLSSTVSYFVKVCLPTESKLLLSLSCSQSVYGSQ